MSIIFVVIIRSLISFFVLLVLVRIIGKQQMSELTFFDYVVGITIGSIASTLSVQVNQNTTATLAGMVVWTVLPIFLGYLSLRNVWIQKVIEGEAIVLIENGKLLEKNLRKVRITTDDVLSQLRGQSVFNLSDVEFAILETNGKLSVQKKSQKQPLTPEDLKLSTQYDGLPTEVIIDGKVLTNALRSLRLSKAWLQYQLSKQGVNEFSEISIAQLDTKGKLYVDLKGDNSSYIIDTTQ